MVHSFGTSCWVKVLFMRSLVICIGVSSQKGGCCGGTLQYLIQVNVNTDKAKFKVKNSLDSVHYIN